MYGIFAVFIATNLCIIVVFSGLANGQAEQQLLNKLVCIEHEECGPCLSAGAHCRWCADPQFSSVAPRCNDEESLKTSGCSEIAIQHPEAPIWEVNENKPLQDMQPDVSNEAVVQIQPQRIRLSIKPRETRVVKFSYRPAKNYPLDLYYLMDLTWSMKDDKETLVSLRDDLPVLLKNLTDNFRLGFGSFAEKPLMPFTSMDRRRRENPCAMEEEACEPTYSYHHHLSLTNKVSDFIERVNKSSVTANLDNAEAQLDALVQVITCSENIGWSPHSRKIVILLSDGLVHTAGDGKLGGAIKKNDEKCHLDEHGYYAEAVTYDYPTIAQVYKLLVTYKVNVIFAVTESVKTHYDSLHKLLEDFTYVAKLESDSSNILKLVKTGYEDIVSVVDFRDDASIGAVKVKYFTDCGVSGGSMIEATRCTGVEFGMTLNYEAHVSLESCPEYKKSYQKIRISESQLGQDSLLLDVELQCGCDCQSDSAPNMSLSCPPNSHLVCGVCLCDQGWSGPSCDCSIEDEAASAALVAQCRAPQGTLALPCSGAGDCLCGKCKCDRGYTGKYCQCKTCGFSRENGGECGGAGRGSCVCGRCACVAGWRGDACDCSESTAACLAPGSAHNSTLCSGHGDCVCGKCECSSTADGSERYTGRFCEACATCENPICAHAESCVRCYLARNCSDVCLIYGHNYTVLEKYHEAVVKDDEQILCIYQDFEDGLECSYTYNYKVGYKQDVAMEISLRTKECYQPTSAKIMTSGLIIFVCVIAAGIVVILGVKCAQMVSDRRAYAKFLQEAQESRKNMQELNPLYISPISEFRIPEGFPRDKSD